jgi:mRNA interferase RelE/StbE
MNIQYRPTAVKQIKKLQKKDQKKILRIIEELSADPFAGKKLKGEFAGLYSLRAWPYRIIYSVDERHSILILSASHRQGVYK